MSVATSWLGWLGSCTVRIIPYASKANVRWFSTSRKVNNVVDQPLIVCLFWLLWEVSVILLGSSIEAKDNIRTGLMTIEACSPSDSAKLTVFINRVH